MMSRRTMLGTAAAGALGAAPERFRLAICSETFPGASFSGICETARRAGYTGLEIDPSNLSEDPASLTAAQRRSLKDQMKVNGLHFCGLHSFLKAPKGLHLTTPDSAARARTLDYFARLIDLAADLGPSPVMVLGSSKQRQAINDVTPADAAKRVAEALSKVAPQASRRGVTILLEPLAPHLCNVINTMAEAIAVVEQVKSPAVQSMFDTHNTTAETAPLPDVIRKHFARIRHVHLNELDGKYPGAGNFPFTPVLQALRDLNYRGWLSVEVFDFKPDGETVARLAAGHIRNLEQGLK
ncbi:MAG: sugar phosphate isomerase/epimerase [Acidobacteria bacterium]|nr:sugar phosphate isomerase/epimerase [Acidobacteriota bacterium]